MYYSSVLFYEKGKPNAKLRKEVGNHNAVGKLLELFYFLFETKA